MWYQKVFLFEFKLGRIISSISIWILLFIYLVILPYNHIPYSSMTPIEYFIIFYTVIFRLISGWGIKYFTKKLQSHC
ncbi:hypothetical protein [Helicobacter sp. 13S00482-2]|uniref:hypothetical protein n=1 Tax=Helicobacter sp. 13S00482-2 TaxID=1476200 RepID=UPI0015DA6F1E|nr:hypothetical protein [Helicobacter sp. 13S00482-2]